VATTDTPPRARPVSGLAKTTGTARYATDVWLPGLLHVRTLRSPHAHARIVGVDTRAAAALPGVHAVLTYRDVPFYLVGEEDGERQDKAILEDTVRYVGDEVAVVAAESEDLAQDAVALIAVEYEPLPAVFDARAALAPDAPLVRPDGNIARVPGTNFGNPIMGSPIDRAVDTEWGHLKPTYLFARGDLAAGFAAADVVLERDFEISPMHGASLEPRGCVAAWEDGRLTVWDSTQKPFTVRSMLAKLFDLPLEQVRVVATFLGGGFGTKENLQRYEALAALLARRTGRPVKYWLSREEELLCTWTRYGCHVRVKVGARRDGALTALHLRVIANQGNGIYQNTFPVRVSGHQALVLYGRCPHARFEGYCVYTNLPSGGGTRGFGRPELLFGLESTLDDLAYALGVDPIALRLQNLVRAGDDLGGGFRVSSAALDECLLESRARFNWDARRPTPGAQPGPVKRGIGMAAAIHSGGNTFRNTESEVELTADGTILLKTGIPDQGTEQETTQRLFVARELGIAPSAVASIWADTETCPHDFGIFTSSSTTAKGAATVAATRAWREALFALAGDLLGLPPDSLALAEDRVYAACDPTRAVTLAAIAAAAERRGAPVRGVGRPEMPLDVGLFSFATNFVEVEVDTRSGDVRILRVLTALDVGQCINPLLLDGQMRAATIQGMSFALFEGLRFDSVERGVPLNGGFLDYKLPSALDVPEIECFTVDSYEPLHPFGAKGAGELAMNPTAPAIANAIYHATGVRLTATPLSRAALLRALRAQAG
jgi:xanthine dehydrogenase molybdenum-binding subunit